ncbi:hypothetical protein [Hymenobacter defluvii]|uniref:DUF2306 domain-containing protein n=2 Tax=Hymenobacter TaxID=89966 RepID=A0ABS3TAE4_9BACT|nr:hypothetical protein [Hymenobacter defluvii]MBO3270625.1 hypothetical protein [Hymenobacter defluvii]
MPTLFYSFPGFLHLVAAVSALLLGPSVLLAGRWGTYSHKRLGYAYLGSMVVMLVTAFGVYRVYHAFGVFHYAALLTLATLLAGMMPVIIRKPASAWLTWHYYGMYWSVMELYVGLVAEVLSHQPHFSFLTVASWSVGLVFLPGGLVFWWYHRQWKALVRQRPMQP